MGSKGPSVKALKGWDSHWSISDVAENADWENQKDNHFYLEKAQHV